MLRHIAMFKWAATATKERQRAAADALERLPTLVPGVRTFRLGPDIGLADGNYDFAVVADFDNVGSYLTYRDHPAHQNVLADLVRPILEARVAVQFDYDSVEGS